MATPTVRIPDEFQPGTSLRQLVDQASRWIEGAFPDLPFALTAEWRPAKDGTVILRLTDGDNSREVDLRPYEIGSRVIFGRRLNGLFQEVNGDAMRALSNRLRLIPAGADQ